MAKPDLLPMGTIDPVTFQKYERYLPTAFDESLSLLEKMNKIIHYMNEIGDLTNEMLTQWNAVYDWVMNEGLEEAVTAQLVEWLNDGTLTDIVYDAIEQLAGLKADITYVDSRFDQIAYNVVQFGADPTGQKDSTSAFHTAMSTGGRTVFVPKGTYLTTGLRIPSNTHLYGVGEGSEIKLIDTASNSVNLMTNSDWVNGNKNIKIENLYLNWNNTRPGGTDPITTGNVDGCALVLVNTQYAKIKGVKAVNAGRHNFDFSASRYHHDGDSPTTYETDGCKFIWVEDCYAEGSGDDNFTTHFSNYIWINNCTSVDPAGYLFEGSVMNGNCFEIDDGSKYVVVHGCYAKGGARGFESKAHDHSPAPIGVTFSDCMAEGNIRCYDIRHNGFHGNDDPYSTTAMNVNIIGCTAINPVIHPNYASLDPRALSIGSYKQVNVTNFTAIGGADEIAENVISIQQKSRQVNLTNVTIRDFDCQYAINLDGGANQTDYVHMHNIMIDSNVEQGIHIGGDVSDISIQNATIIGRNKTDSYGIAAVQSDINVQNLLIDGFTTKVKLGSETSNTNYTRHKAGGFIASTTTGIASHKNSSVLSSIGGSAASGEMSAVLASSTGTASGQRSFLAGTGVSSSATGAYSSVISSRASKASDSRSIILASYGVESGAGNAVAGGWAETDTPSSINRKWQLNSANGNITAEGTIQGGGTFSDYGEYFESADGSAIATGKIVTLSGTKITTATTGDYALGVVSETAGITLGGSCFCWSDRYLRDEFGGYIMQEKTVTEIDENNQTITYTVTAPTENPDFDPTQEYVPREERDEWHVIALLGQAYVQVGQSVVAGDTIIPGENGIGVTGESSWRVMAISSAYDSTKGYAVAKVLIR